MIVSERIKAISRYFYRNIENDSLFKPAHDASIRILTIAEKEQLNKDDFETIRAIILETEKQVLYKGSGWLDLKLNIRGLALAHGIEFDLD